MAEVSRMPEHIFGAGDVTYVLNQTMSGKVIIEGKARVVRRLLRDHLYEVRFLGDQDRAVYDRFIRPGDEYQAELIKREEHV